MTDATDRDRGRSNAPDGSVRTPTVAVPGLGPASPPAERGAEPSEPGRDSEAAGPEGGIRPPEQGEWCRNCDTKLVGPYCAACGQRADEYSVSLAVLARDAADEYLSFDSRLFRTLVALVFRPGYLTRQYLVGRRARYVRPLRLYIVASLLFFLAFSFFGGGFRPNIQIGDSPPPGERVRASGTAASIDSLSAAERAEITDAVTRDLSRSLPGVQTIGILGFEVDPQERVERLASLGVAGFLDAFAASAERYLPRMMFLLLPFFALILKILYVRRRWYYAEHFIFALHIHAFVFALFLMMLAMPSGLPPTWMMVGWGMLYVLLAMRRVYRQGWIRTGLKYMMLAGAYSVALFFTFLSLVVATALVA
jgi:hypothetical protein